jgi:hypothetical protein
VEGGLDGFLLGLLYTCWEVVVSFFVALLVDRIVVDVDWEVLESP